MRTRLWEILLRVGIAFCLTASLSFSAWGGMPWLLRNDPPRIVAAGVSPSFDAGARTTSGTTSTTQSINRLCTNAGCTTTSASGITTTHTPDEIIVFVAANACSFGSGDHVTVTSAHLTFTFRTDTRGFNCNSNDLLSFSAQSSGLLSNEVITVTCSPCAGVSYQEAFACAFYNMNTGTPFDPNGALPYAATTGATSITTTHAADMLVAGFRAGGAITPDSGWSVCAQIDFGGAEYEQVSTTQSGTAVTGGGTNNGVIGDALQGP